RRPPRARPRGRGRPPSGLRAARRAGPLDRELPVPAEADGAPRRGARPDQPPDHPPPRGRRLLLPRPDDPEGTDRPTGVDHELSDEGGGLGGAAGRSGKNRRGVDAIVPELMIEDSILDYGSFAAF